VTNVTSVSSPELIGDTDYLRDVLLNMEWIRNRDDRRVRFNTRSMDGRPDYQTEYPVGHRLQNFPRRYDGQAHTLLGAASSESLIDEPLTKPYAWDDVLRLLKQALDRKHAITRITDAA
jgi:hypothetical protein